MSFVIYLLASSFTIGAIHASESYQSNTTQVIPVYEHGQTTPNSGHLENITSNAFTTYTMNLTTDQFLTTQYGRNDEVTRISENVMLNVSMGNETVLNLNTTVEFNDTHSNETVLEENVISESELDELIFVGYSKNRRPRRHASDVVEVTLGIFIYNINGLIEKSHEMRITCALSVRWKDDFLVWNESEKFSSIRSLTVQREEVWIPDVALVNSGDMYALMMAEGILANIQSDGSVEFLPMSTISSFCDMDLTYFPFDYQSCSLRFESWTYEPNQETFALAHDAINIEKLKTNEQWHVLKAKALEYQTCNTASNDSCYKGIEFQLYFQRKAAYYNVNIIIPSLIIAIVEIVTFSLPTPEVMKVHISFTCLLAYAVFQTTINTDMPRTSEHTPLMSIYIDLQMAFIGIALLGEGVVFICLGQAEHHRVVPAGLRPICNIIARIVMVDTVNADLEEKILEKQEADEMKPHHSQQDDNGNDGGESYHHKSIGESIVSPMYTATTMTVSPWPVVNGQFTDTSKLGMHMPEESFKKYFQVFEDQQDKDRKLFAEKRRQNRVDWLFIADVAERLTLIIYVLCISFAPLVIFYILPSLYSKMPNTVIQ